MFLDQLNQYIAIFNNTSASFYDSENLTLLGVQNIGIDS